MSGPVQVLVVEFDEPSFSGDVIGEFMRLREAGTVRSCRRSPGPP
jgi:hypothetical protein